MAPLASTAGGSPKLSEPVWIRLDWQLGAGGWPVSTAVPVHRGTIPSEW